MEAKAKNVVGVYETEQEAIHAVDSLKKEGYASEEISIIGKHKKTKKVQKETNTKAEGAATGALTGGTLGSLTGILAGGNRPNCSGWSDCSYINRCSSWCECRRFVRYFSRYGNSKTAGRTI